MRARFPPAESPPMKMLEGERGVAVRRWCRASTAWVSCVG